MTFWLIMSIFMRTKKLDHPNKLVPMPMRRTFTLFLLLSAMMIFSTKNSSATTSMSSTYGDIRFGEKELIKIYPNPMVSDATIKISDDVDFEKNKVAIVFYNIVGSEVYRINQVRDAEVKINRDIFKNSGIYFYQLKVDESVMSTGRITVK